MAIIEANDANFQELIQGDYVVVDCYGDHCNPCKLLAPNYERVASEMDHICFAKFNAEHNPKVTGEYEIYGIPRLMFFRNGELVQDAVGYKTMPQLRALIADMLYG